MRIRTTNNNRRSRDRRALARYWDTLPDNCRVCDGTRGGMRGNENVVFGIVCCDYCHADGSVDEMARKRERLAPPTRTMTDLGESGA